ncbi:hypothetical protein WOLCODRAFT_147093 [Wolfiporia cocos MD-104 SS10]|uniref:Ankyrin n=1 Tax=Wolfiporia cocos (strain MD-104) TaxID=742152 RepID=A0A2H3IZM3_WOLCO|nr:hypothetical protein WOLCODRAFT_147093 [Wolfiporia cocos MD-104 SS10]
MNTFRRRSSADAGRHFLVCKRRAEINAVDPSDELSALQKASKAGSAENVVWMLEHGAECSMSGVQCVRRAARYALLIGLP